MSGLSRRLKQLDEELLALGEETTLLEELDGFIAGLLVCPDLIKPGEWLPIIWDRDSTDQQPAFQDLDHVNRVLGLVMEHYNSVARTLMERPDRYSPLHYSPSTPAMATSSGSFGSRASRRPPSYDRTSGRNSSTPMPIRRPLCAE